MQFDTVSIFRVVVAGATLITSVLVHAQNSSIVGGASFASECYQASQAASLAGSANRQGLEICNRAINDAALSPKDLMASYVNRGVVYMAMNDLESALKDLNHALSMNGDLGEAHVNRGNLWFMAGRLSKAVDDYDLAIELGVEKLHVAHLNRGMALEQLGKLADARDAYKSSIKHFKNWPEAKTRLKRVKQKIKKQNREQRNSNSNG